MPTAEQQRLREENERREELERSTRAQTDALAAARIQRQRMDEIKRIQGLGMTISDARGVGTALQAVLAFDPSSFGEMESMAMQTQSLAQATLEMRLLRVLKLELPGAIEEAYAMNALLDESGPAADALIAAALPASAYAPLAPVTVIPTPLAQCDSAVLRAFRVILNELRRTRDDSEIRILFNDEMEVMPGRFKK